MIIGNKKKNFIEIEKFGIFYSGIVIFGFAVSIFLLFQSHYLTSGILIGYNLCMVMYKLNFGIDINKKSPVGLLMKWRKLK